MSTFEEEFLLNLARNANHDGYTQDGACIIKNKCIGDYHKHHQHQMIFKTNKG